MAETMRAIAVTAPRVFTRVALPRPEAGPGQVLVRVAYCGICGSDVPRYFDGAVHAYPQVLGHEFSGVVAAVGPGVTGPEPGTAVAVAPHLPCGRCHPCRAGRPTLCLDYSFIGSREQGAMAGYVVAPARNAVPVAGLSLRHAALVEPMSVALHAIMRLPGRCPRRALVLGGGVIGLMTLLGLLDRGVEVTVVDINDWALDVAASLGAAATINTARQSLEAALADTPAPEVVFETAGATGTIIDAVKLAGPAATVVYVGKPTRPVELGVTDFEAIERKELTVLGSWLSYSEPFPGPEWVDAVRVLHERAGDLTQLITHEFSLDEAEAGLAAMAAGVKRLKVLFRVGDDG